MRRALISVHDKTGLVPFARTIIEAGYAIVSSGGTAAALSAAGLPVTQVEQVTGSPEILGGRVKTLHPSIHGGILARGGADEEELGEMGIERFDLVVVNLYPFAETVKDPDSDHDAIVEMIDIGGPAMIRAAAKNHRHVTVVVDPDQYSEVGEAVASGSVDDDLRSRLAAEAFFVTASYDAAIVAWLGRDLVVPLRWQGELRYGENPHQAAGLYIESRTMPWWQTAEQTQGKEMSFNNYADADAAWRLAGALGPGSAVVVKHTNPAGAAVAPRSADAFERAWEGDPMAAFGGVVALNGTIDATTASAIAEKFVEVLIARSVDDDARAILDAKKNLRVLVAPGLAGEDLDFRRIEGGFLVQARDVVTDGDWKTVSDREPSAAEMEDLRLAWMIAAHTKSNAVVIVKDGAAVGVGAGDQSRVGAAERAVVKARARARGSVAASDAFFPFRDGLDTLAGAGVTAIVQPGGSRNDAEVVAAANEHRLALVHTGERHFLH